MSQIRRPEDEQQNGGQAGRHQQTRGPLQLLLLDAAPHVDVADVRHGRLDQPAPELRRVVGPRLTLALLAFLDRAQHRGLQRRFVLLQIERDTLVRDTPRNGVDEEPPPETEQRQIGQDAERDDGARAESEQLQAVRRDEQRAEGGRHQDGHAAERHAQAPSVPHMTDGTQDLDAIAGKERLSEHQFSLVFPSFYRTDGPRPDTVDSCNSGGRPCPHAANRR